MKECKRQEIIDQFWKDIDIKLSNRGCGAIVWYRNQYYRRTKDFPTAKLEAEQLLKRILRGVK